MGRKRHSPEQIIRKLRSADVDLAKGLSVAEICKKLEVTMQTYYRWRKEFGGLDMSQVRRLKVLEKENGQLKKLVAEQALDNSILRIAAEGNF